MTTQTYRRLALEITDATEGSHQGHADFRLQNKVFASLGYPSAGFGMVILPSPLQRDLIAVAPNVFSAATGAWGKAGSTLVTLKTARVTSVRVALAAAANFRATKK